MRILQNAGFSNPLHPVIGQGVQETSRGIRSGPANNDGAERITPMVADSLRWGDSAIFIVAGWEWRDESRPTHTPGNLFADRKTRPHLAHVRNQAKQIVHDWRHAGGLDADLAIEVGNELDLTDCWRRGKLDEYPAYCMAVYEAVREVSREVTVITGSVSNFRKRPHCFRSRRGYDVLKKLSEHDWPADTVQGVHPYRNDLRSTEFHGYADDDEALDALAYLLKGRRVAVTEMGWHSRRGWSDEEIAGFVADEIERWRRFGATHYVHYQIQDGPKPDNAGEGGFGAFTNLGDGFSPKPVAAVLKKQKGRS